MRLRTSYSEQELTAMEDTVRGSTDARRTTAMSGSSCKAAIQQTISRRGESAPSPPFHYQLSLTGQLPSGKNQVQLLWRNGKVCRYPNKIFANWRAKAGLELLEQIRPAVPLSAPIRLTVDYWPGDMIVRDVSGQLDALFSLLVYAQILNNDGLVYDVRWQRHALNRQFPRLLMEIAPWG